MLIGCRNPQKVVVMSNIDGKLISSMPVGAGVDATQFDEGKMLASRKDGSLYVVRESSPGKFDIVSGVDAAGVRTMGIEPSNT